MGTYNSIDKLIEEARLWVKNNPEEFEKIIDDWINDKSKEILHKAIGIKWGSNPTNKTLCGYFNQECTEKDELVNCKVCLEMIESNNNVAERIHLAHFDIYGNFYGAYCGHDIDVYETTVIKSGVTCRYCLPQNYKVTKEFTRFNHKEGVNDGKVCIGKECYCMKENNA